MLTELERIIPDDKQTRPKRPSADARQFSNQVVHSARRGEFVTTLDQIAHENATLRKPCTICGNLVKPELLDQHNDAYHSK